MYIHCRSSSGSQKRGERERERERSGRSTSTKRSHSREINKEREAAIRVRKKIFMGLNYLFAFCLQAVKSQTSTEAKPHTPPPVSKATPPPLPTTPTPLLDEDTISRKTHTIVDELSDNKDYKVMYIYIYT